ncbi:MAG: secondary thiamine-phosphate synthase enzyme YjbQ [Candidatus Diapherotrites archaeon]|nr:secondary thiamine-phosphate synthase enzyme YjbQ [Candidatus Diapherotrites archaeon]
MIEFFSIKTNRREEIVDITKRVEEIVLKSKIKEGLCVVFVPHTTAALTINENADPSVKRDILDKLAKLLPMNDNYAHSEGNSDAHIKSSLIGNSVSLLVKDSVLVLGTWQGILFCEFDGPRERKVIVLVLSNE